LGTKALNHVAVSLPKENKDWKYL